MSSSSITNGWVKLHRSLLEWEWWDDLNTRVFFIYCLLRANPSDKQWRGIPIKRGSFLTSRQKMSAESKLTERELRTAIQHLEKTGELTCETTKEYTIITICNYDKYQVREEIKRPTERPTSDQAPTNERPSTDQRATTNEESKESKEIYNYVDDACARARESDVTPMVPSVPTDGQGDLTDTFYNEYRTELAGQTENAIRAQRMWRLSADEVVALLDEYHDKQKLNGSVYTSRRDYRQHFTMWAEKRIAMKRQTVQQPVAPTQQETPTNENGFRPLTDLEKAMQILKL